MRTNKIISVLIVKLKVKREAVILNQKNKLIRNQKAFLVNFNKNFIEWVS